MLKLPLSPLAVRHGELPPEQRWYPLTDEVINTLLLRLEVLGCKTRRERLLTLIESDLTPDYHPLLDYVEHLPQWDGHDHIADLCARVHLSAPTPIESRDGDEASLFLLAMRKWLVSLIAGVFDENYVNHQILVLIGPQGTYKSTFLEHLLPPELRRYYMVKSDVQLITKDDKFDFSENILINWEELDTLTPRELNQLKAITTATHINERRAYGRYKEYRPHIASFCGTGNNVAFLTDTTGNRRWLPFLVSAIDAPQEHPIDYAALYAQIFHLYMSGFRYWMDRDEMMRLERHNRQFCVPEMERELILETFEPAPPSSEAEPEDLWSPSRITARLNVGVRQQLSVRAVVAALRDMGFRETILRDGGRTTGFWVRLRKK